MKPFLAGDARARRRQWRATSPLWMAYEDIIRVADLKTRASRFERVQKGSRREGRRAGGGDRLPEAGRRGVRVRFASLSWEENHRSGRKGAASSTPTTSACTSSTSGIFGYAAGAQRSPGSSPGGRISYRYREEQQLIERWLALVGEAARRDATLAFEVAECARLVKGYGETHRRGKANFLAIVDALVENPATADRARAGGGDSQGARGRARRSRGQGARQRASASPWCG